MAHESRQRSISVVSSNDAEQAHAPEDATGVNGNQADNSATSRGCVRA